MNRAQRVNEAHKNQIEKLTKELAAARQAHQNDLDTLRKAEQRLAKLLEPAKRAHAYLELVVPYIVPGGTPNEAMAKEIEAELKAAIAQEKK